MRVDPKIKPSLWNIKTGIVAYNASGMGLPMPVGLWAMWEGAGNKVFDLGRQQNEGTFVNGPTWAPGGLNFVKADSEYVNLGANTNLLRNVTGSTLFVVLTRTGDNTQDVVPVDISKGDGTSSRMELKLLAQSNPGNFWLGGRALDAGAWGSQTTTGTPIGVANKKYVIAATMHYASDTIKIYVDGVEQATAGAVNWAATHTSDTSPQAVTIGADAGIGSYFDGNIFEVILWDINLSHSQIIDLSADPYALLQQPRSIWAVEGAGVIPRDIAGALPAMAGALARKHYAKRPIQGAI